MANRPRNDSEAQLMFQSKANYILGKDKKLGEAPGGVSFETLIKKLSSVKCY